MSKDTVYYDFRTDPLATCLKNVDPQKILMEVLNRYDWIYREASFRFLKTDNEAVKVGYLNVMLKAEEKSWKQPSFPI